MTLPDIQQSGIAEQSIREAAIWLATGGADRSKPITPQIYRKFGLTPAQAVEAIRDSRLILARAL